MQLRATALWSYLVMVCVCYDPRLAKLWVEGHLRQWPNLVNCMEGIVISGLFVGPYLIRDASFFTHFSCASSYTGSREAVVHRFIRIWNLKDIM